MKYTCCFILFTFLLSSKFHFSQTNVCSKIETVQSRIKEFHFNPIDLNKNERQEIAELYVELIDDNNYFLTKEDLTEIQNEASEKGLCDAYKKSILIYVSALKMYDSITSKILEKPITLKKGEQFISNYANNNHLRSSKQDYAKCIELNLKYDFLKAISDKFETDSLLEKKLSLALELEIRTKIAQKEKKFVQRKLKDLAILETQLLNHFLNAIALRYDPHSGYFSSEEKEDFVQELSSDRLVFGIQYIENENFEIEISSLAPGGSAWKSNQISEGDILLAVKDLKGIKYELTNKGIEFVSTILNKNDSEEITFIVKTKSGAISEVKLIKTKIENTENSFTGYLLTDKINKIGYINLPSFYTDFEGDSQLGCANDVAKEIILLKKDSIQGLILDLRNNGGGSLKEAIELSGLFIDEGPMSIYHGKNEKPYLLKDMNRGTVYNGPLIVLVNSLSASASEFFAGCMQDYKRALIVGDSTYGKGTAQSMYPLSFDVKNQDFVKVTNGKFYHVSSRSNQEIGIAPDVLIEDLYSEINYYLEANQKYHLKNDTVLKKTVFKDFTQSQFPETISKSKLHISNTNSCKELKKKAKTLSSKVQNDQKIPLEFEAFLKYSTENKAFWDEIYKEEDNKELSFEIENHTFSKKMLLLDENEQKLNNKLIENLKNDILLNESFLIFKDLITFEK